MRRIFVFARTTAIEVMRQPTFFLILAFGMALILLSPSFSVFTLLQNRRLIQDTGLSTILITGLFLGVFSASGVIYRELKGRTAATILSKRVGRGEFVVGKFFGIAFSITMAIYIMTIVLVAIVRHGSKLAAWEAPDTPVVVFLAAAIGLSLLYGFVSNYFFQKNFCSSTIKAAVFCFTIVFVALCFISSDWKVEGFGIYIPWQIPVASLLLLLGIFVLSTWAIAVSVKFHLPVALLTTSGIFLLGLMSDYIFGRFASSNFAARLMYSLLPNIQFFWVGDALGADMTIPARYILSAGCYAAAYISAILFVASFLLETREID